MDDNSTLIESLLARAIDYGKINYEIVRLHVIDRTTNGISSFIPNTLVFLVLSSALLFFNLGIAFLLGKILGEIFYGFFIVSGFYVLVAFSMYFFMRKWVKRVFYDYLIKQILKQTGN